MKAPGPGAFPNGAPPQPPRLASHTQPTEAFVKYRQSYPHTCTGDCNPSHTPHLQLAADLIQADRHQDTRTSAQLWETNGKEACIHALHIAAHHPDRLPHPNRPTNNAQRAQAQSARPTPVLQVETTTPRPQPSNRHRNRHPNRQARQQTPNSQETQKQQQNQRGQQKPPPAGQGQQPQRTQQQPGQRSTQRQQQPRPPQDHQTGQGRRNRPSQATRQRQRARQTTSTAHQS